MPSFDTNIRRTPGVGTERTAAFRNIWVNREGRRILPLARILDGSISRDPANIGDVDTLRAGMLLGKVTTGGKLAPSIIGTLNRALTATATDLHTMYAEEVTELVRRIGATGTIKITGPAVAGGPVRTKRLAYSATGGGSAVNEVQTFTPSAAATAGTYRIKLSKPDGTYVWTGWLAFDVTLAVCQAAITAALDTVAGWVASSAGSAAPWSAGPIALVLTASGTGYLARDMAMCTIDISNLTGVTTMTEVETTRGCALTQTVTVTAGLTAANDVQTITLNAAMTAGTLTFGIPLLDGTTAWVRLTWDTNIGTSMTAWNVLSDAATGVTGGVVISGTATVPVFTFSGGGYAGRAWPEVLVDITGVTGPATYVFSRIGGNSDAFAVGSLIQPVDGSENPLFILDRSEGTKVTDFDNTNLDIAATELCIGGGVLDASQIVNYPLSTNTGLCAWIKAKLRANSGPWVFDDDL
jgi:hypothetical protein